MWPFPFQRYQKYAIDAFYQEKSEILKKTKSEYAKTDDLVKLYLNLKKKKKKTNFPLSTNSGYLSKKQVHIFFKKKLSYGHK